MSDSGIMTPSMWREQLRRQLEQMKQDGIVPVDARAPECSWEPVSKTVTVSMQVPPGCVVVYDPETGEPTIVKADFGVLVSQRAD